MSALPSDIIHNCIFKFIQNQSNIANVNKRSYQSYKSLRYSAGLKIKKFMYLKQLPNEYFYNVPLIYSYLNHKLLIRYYIANYPQEHLDDIIDSFPIKLMRPELDMSNIPKPRNRRHLRTLLYRCSPTEIFFVGW